ncbi:TPA: phage tail protein, partial [Streptococcus agalactiae]|nr:phage tail protein [Streptococcus agalactiae]
FVARGTDGDVVVIGREGADGFTIDAFKKLVFDGATGLESSPVSSVSGGHH